MGTEDLIRGKGKVIRKTRRAKKGYSFEGECLILEDSDHPTRQVKITGNYPDSVNVGDVVPYASLGDRVGGYTLARYGGPINNPANVDAQPARKNFEVVYHDERPRKPSLEEEVREYPNLPEGIRAKTAEYILEAIARIESSKADFDDPGCWQGMADAVEAGNSSGQRKDAYKAYSTMINVLDGNQSEPKVPNPLKKTMVSSTADTLSSYLSRAVKTGGQSAERLKAYCRRQARLA